ncbi:ATP-dependent DNA ligase [Cytobacillus purgationiresistens]|uniref:DNA ligase-1 n=1 Tax=Cytobacillus purgationiresistens TaxID=863449 RepID=A0ABU0AR15_9BACI|nr:RNA ligase family protein [Cytobacillus purgationiresistens]MDQ0273480.1 DNA ligase-1 [Cytobacillus purgationiresistens]
MYISPMLLQKSSEAFSDDTYLSELKLDGIRLTLYKSNGEVKLYTRHKNIVSNKFKELLTIDIPNGTVLDGEIIVTDSRGHPCFESMMERFQSNHSNHKIQYCVFDVLFYKNKNVMSRTLIERKMMLEEFLPQNDQIVLVKYLAGHGLEYFNLVKEQGLEGIVLKKASSIYRPKSRSYNWLKVINYQHDEVYLTGLRKNNFGVFLSFNDGSPAGIMEFMKPEDRKILYSEYKKYAIRETKDFIFLEPRLKGKVKYRNLTRKGYLRIPSFEHWIKN